MLYTIGTSSRSWIDFVRELDARRITHLVDVRSSPYSRASWFNRHQIEKWCDGQRRMYRWEGKTLGGRSDVALDHPDYLAALDRLAASSTRENVVVFCAEGDPALCHRAWSVGASLLVRTGVSVMNILRDGGEELMIDTLRRVPSQSFDDNIAAEVGMLLGQPTLI